MTKEMIKTIKEIAKKGFRKRNNQTKETFGSKKNKRKIFIKSKHS